MASTKVRSTIVSIAVYILVALSCLAFAALRLRAAASSKQAPITAVKPVVAANPSTPVKEYFQLSTNHTFGTADRARVWINYEGIDHLDFRIYKVKDSFKFFRQLNDPHQLGTKEKTEVTQTYDQKPTPLEKFRAVKLGIFKTIKNYFRQQLHPATRDVLTQKLRGGQRPPLNVADFARVPLLNSDQLVESWREPLPVQDTTSDSRMVMMGKRDPGVYLVEAVNGGLRAYTIAIVTDLSMVTKTSPDGAMLIYAVNRKSGAPEPGVEAVAVKGKKTIATGTTDASGILRTTIPVEKAAAQLQEHPEDEDQAAESQVGRNSYLIMIRHESEFAINDLEPYYFTSGGEGGQEGEDEGDENGGSGDLAGYVYSDRPVYRPAETVFFKAIIRRLGEDGYQMLGMHSVRVTVEDPNSSKVFDADLPLSPRGSLDGKVDIADGAPLGTYEIKVSVPSMGTVSGSFDVQEYKKPEYKVTVSTPKTFVQVGQKTSFTIQAKYFYGSPVTNAAVQYYIYRSRYYPWWWASSDDSDDLGEDSQAGDEEQTGDYGYGNDMVKDGTGKVDSNGAMTVDFEVPETNEKAPSDYTYRLEAQVTDAARREIEGKASFTGTRGNVVASANPDRYVYYQGEHAHIQVRTSDYEGHPLSATITLKFVRRTWDKIDKGGDNKYDRYEYKLKETEMGSADVTTSPQGNATYDYTVPAIGDFEIQALVHGNNKQYLSTGGYLWAADRGEQWADFSFEDYSQIKLIPDKKSYQPGDIAHVLAMLPSEKVHLLVTAERETVMTSRVIDAPGRAAVIDVPIDARYSPNVFLNVLYIKDGDMFSQDHSLSVPARNKFLKIELLTD
ncbi:MAG TPA: MG2 domain-containing protein, partial [Blastocatellia bacterium]|nr:MG2 domain-containing protein [Blastocatellia bacterium]